MENRKKQLAGNTAILLVGKISTQFLSFFLLPLYTAILAPEEYGIVDLFNTYITLLLPIVGFQMDLGLFRFMLDARGGEKEQKRLLSTVLLSNAFHAFVYILLYLLVQTQIHSEYKIFLLLHVVLNVFSSTLLQFARGLGNNAAYSIAGFMSALVTILLNILFVAVIRIGALGLFWGVVGGQVTLISYLLISQKVWHFFSVKSYDRLLVKELYHYSVPLIPSVISWWVINASDRTVIRYALNIAANGIYSVASKFSSIINVFYGIFNMAWIETVSLHIDDVDSSCFLSDTVDELYKMFFTICISVISVMPFVFPVLVNQQYAEAFPLIPIMVLAVFGQILCGLFSVVFLARKDTKESAKTAIFAAIINLTIDIVFIRLIGLYAAAFATMVAFFSMAIYRYKVVQKYACIKLSRKTVLYSLLVTAIVLGAYYYGNIVMQGIVFVLVVGYSVLVNLNAIKSLLDVVCKWIRKDRQA